MRANIHNARRHAFDTVLLDYFESRVFPAHLFEDEQSWSVVLDLLPDHLRTSLRQPLVDEWTRDESLTPFDRWSQFRSNVELALVRASPAPLPQHRL